MLILYLSKGVAMFAYLIPVYKYLKCLPVYRCMPYLPIDTCMPCLLVNRCLPYFYLSTGVHTDGMGVWQNQQLWRRFRWNTCCLCIGCLLSRSVPLSSGSSVHQCVQSLWRSQRLRIRSWRDTSCMWVAVDVHFRKVLRNTLVLHHSSLKSNFSVNCSILPVTVAFYWCWLLSTSDGRILPVMVASWLLSWMNR